MADGIKADIEAVQRIDSVPLILEVVCRTTGMGFAAVARVTESRWVCCAVRDEIAFGLVPGSELQIETTICHEIRQSHQAVVIDHVAENPVFRDHHTPAYIDSFVCLFPCFNLSVNILKSFCRHINVLKLF